MAELDPRIGSLLGAYRIEAVIGRGGMGVVYRATDTNLDRPVALKLLGHDYVDDEAFRARFLRESKMAAAIDHPNIIPIYEAGERDGTYFLAMRFVQGADLASRLRAGPLEARAVVSLLGQVAGALDAAHGAGLVHRDVKPANLLVASGHGADRSDHVYLTDFGLTKQRGSQSGLTRTGSFLGTLEYVSPEQIEGKAVDGRADQYALAAIAVECLTGDAPFPRDSDLAIVNAHLRDAPPSVHERRPDLPAATDAVVARGLAKDPAARYPDCQSFIDDLRSALGVTDTQSRPHATVPRGRPTALIAGAVAVVALVIVLGAIGLTAGRGGTPTTSPNNLGAVEPSVTAMPSPTEDVFPNAGESALLDVLPGDLSATCERGSYDLVYGEYSDSASGRPQVSLTCSPPGSSGADAVSIKRFVDAGLSAGNTGFTVDQAVSGIAQRGEIPGGDCSTEPRVNGRWDLGGQDMGALLCSSGPGRPTAILYWTYTDAAILVLATNKSGDGQALYDYFLDTARFISP